MIFCPSCGKSIPADSKFCTYCGALIPAIETRRTTERIVDEPRVVEPRVVDETRSVRRERVVRADGRPLYTPALFITSPGFWGAILVLVGFFLPWWLSHGTPESGMQYVRTHTEQLRWIFLLFPISAFIILIQSLTSALPAGMSGFFKFIPFLLLLAFVAIMVLGETSTTTKNQYGLDFHDFPNLFRAIRIGLWATIIGSLLMLFHKKYMRVA